MAMRYLPSFLLLPALAACAAVPYPETASPDGIVRAAIGQRVYVDGPNVTPLAVIEDSRCPMNARCIWAGRTRLSVRIELGSRSEIREIGSDKPIPVADGQLSLVEIQPDAVAGQPVDASAYRFGFAFAGGL